MDQRVYFVVDLDGLGFVFDNIKVASAFLVTAVDHAKQGRYCNRRPHITMFAESYEQLHESFPAEYPIEPTASMIKYAEADLQACSDADSEA